VQELITSLVNQLGISQSQAQSGAGAIFKAAQERMGADQFEQLLGGMPGINELLAHAPATDSGGGGLLGGFASMASSFGGGDLAMGAKLLAAFGSLGMNKDTLVKFRPIVLQFLESQGGQELVTKLRAALKL
jgi:Protein of unknown function VcgC/VcgE (DUF2780)